MMLKDIYNWIQTNVPEFGEGTVLTSLTLMSRSEIHAPEPVGPRTGWYGANRAVRGPNAAWIPGLHEPHNL